MEGHSSRSSQDFLDNTTRVIFGQFPLATVLFIIMMVFIVWYLRRLLADERTV